MTNFVLVLWVLIIGITNLLNAEANALDDRKHPLLMHKRRFLEIVLLFQTLGGHTIQQN